MTSCISFCYLQRKQTPLTSNMKLCNLCFVIITEYTASVQIFDKHLFVTDATDSSKLFLAWRVTFYISQNLYWYQHFLQMNYNISSSLSLSLFYSWNVFGCVFILIMLGLELSNWDMIIFLCIDYPCGWFPKRNIIGESGYWTAVPNFAIFNEVKDKQQLSRTS